ncbi:MAG: SEL1-like repeat protein [Gammaproteobacteria bacterium]|nr:SEL1-like repeat protein [Gammaproteobacteria bacterium]
MKKTTMILFGASVLLLAGCASTPKQDFAQGSQEYKNQSYSMSYYHVMRAAKAGDPDAEYALGYMYYYGRGADQDYKQAMYWIKKAARDGQPLAQRALRLINGADQPTVIKAKPAVVLHPRYQHKAAAKKVAHSNSKKLLSQERILLKRPKNHYALQLMASQNKRTIQSLVSKYNLKHVYYYRKRVVGRLWYALVYGNFATKKAAIASVRRLPKALQQVKPWALSFAQIQHEIALS